MTLIDQYIGLGLSIFYGFVRQPDGQLRIYSEVGEGTTMCLYLSRHYGVAEQADVMASLSDSLTAASIIFIFNSRFGSSTARHKEETGW